LDSSRGIDTKPVDIETQLVDLNSTYVDQVLREGRESLEPFLAELFSQVQRPRFNLGSGPPGRAD
jgi:hypothetical protein